MSQPDRPPYAVDELPYLWRIPAAILNFLLDQLEARHDRSWEQGRESILRENGALTPVSSEGHEPGRVTRITVRYRDGMEHQAPGKDRAIFNPQRLSVTAELKSMMRGDCASFLAANLQPSAEQWKAIFSSTHTTSITGSAGTGKSTVLLFRVLFLHRYLGVDLKQISILTFSRESRLEMAAELSALFSKWNIPLESADAHRIVKTPRSAVLELAHSLPDLDRCVPFEVLNETGSEAIHDGRPFDTRLLAGQREAMWKCFQDLYKTNRRFAELVLAMFAESARVEPLDVDNPEVVKRAPMGWAISDSDGELCDCVEALWRNAGMWPLEGINPTRKQFTLRGRTYNCNGYVPQLDAHLVLGFDRSESPHLTRNSSVKIETYKEVAVKRTLFRSYFSDRLIHLDSYQEASQLVETMKSLSKVAPDFTYKLQGMSTAVPILEAFNEIASLIDALGLEVSTVAGQMNFIAGDVDACFFEALGIYWQALERHLLALPRPSLTYGRLFDLFSDQHPENLAHLPIAALGRYRHLLIDNAEDHGVPVSSWAKGVLSEIRRRDLKRDSSFGVCSSLFIAGDSNQWVFGSKGTSPQRLTDLESGFPAPTPPTKINLPECYRSSQAVIDAGHNLVHNLGVVSGRVTVSAQRGEAGGAGVQMWGDDADSFRRLCKAHYDAGNRILILAETPQDIAWLDTAAGDLVREDRTAGGRRIRVRSYHKAKALEADVVFLVGDPACGSSSWYRNQLYKIAGFSTGGDLAPGDTVLENEALRLVHVAITRAKQQCYWFPRTGNQDGRTASNLVSLSPGLFKDNR